MVDAPSSNLNNKKIQLITSNSGGKKKKKWSWYIIQQTFPHDYDECTPNMVTNQLTKLTSPLSCSNKKAQSVWLSTQPSLNAESYSHLKQSILIPVLTFCTHGKPFWNKRQKDQCRKLILDWIPQRFSCKKKKDVYIH